jgi:hypothetical protein
MATVADAFGRTLAAEVSDGQISLPVSDTPLFVDTLKGAALFGACEPHRAAHPA